MNKIALITGATSGIGQATALKAAEAGFDVIITGRRNDRLQELAESIRQKGADVLPLAFDIRQSGEVETAIRNLGGKWRDISVLVNNAGLAVGVAPIQEGVLDDWERMIDTNVKGLLYITRAVAPLMIARNTGHIVNLASNIAPGMVETEFSIVRYKGDKEAADKVYQGMTPLTNEDIAETIIFAITRPAHVCLNDIVIMPTAQANSRDVDRK